MGVFFFSHAATREQVYNAVKEAKFREAFNILHKYLVQLSDYSWVPVFIKFLQDAGKIYFYFFILPSIVESIWSLLLKYEFGFYDIFFYFAFNVCKLCESLYIYVYLKF